MAAGKDAVDAGIVEGERQQGLAGFGRVAAAMEVWVKDVADLGLPGLRAAQDQRNLADHLPVLAPLHGEEDLVAFARPGELADPGLHRLGASLPAHRSIDEPAGHILTRAVGM